MSEPLPFIEFLQRGSEAGGLQTDDVLTAMLPLLRRIASLHERSRVAELRGPSSIVANGRGELALVNPIGLEPTLQLGRIEGLQKPPASALHVVGHARVTSDADTGTEYTNLDVIEEGVPLTRPAYVPGYQSWENLLGHHDALTDVFCAGLLLAALALDVDLSDVAELKVFAGNRANLFAVNPRVHPVIAAVIVEMTELNRHRRAADMTSIVGRLENYREQTPDIDIAQLPGFAAAGVSQRRQIVQVHLRDRLFEISRRNRLLYFRPTQSTVNLTVASVPLVVNLNSIRFEQLFVWHEALASEVTQCRPLSLGKWLRFEDQAYLPAALDRLIADARRDRAEFGFAQLRLVIAFLHWHNLKEAQHERIVTPLLLLPVELTRKRGVRDQYVLEPTSSEAEINPVLRHHLRQLYGLNLPESLDLTEMPLTRFHAQLQAQIRQTEPGVTLRLVDQPEVQLIQECARQRLAQYQRRQRTQAATRTPASSDYSYDREDFRPRGLQLFLKKVKPADLPQRAAAGGLPLSRPQMAPSSAAVAPNETEQRTFALREHRPANPYAWDFDLCSVTVGNFNYRKMSLVRDYGSLIEEAQVSEAFDGVFSVDPRPLDDAEAPTLEVADEWPVVKADATQRAAVAFARTGRSYIVQGPPGTGKSQTITNLIADFVARGKRVLFVCEKRAAIDVVFHRLRQQGLDELCCLIHDSQTDKKSFVQNLKQTYEDWLAQPDGYDSALEQRNALLARMDQELATLRRFDALMRSVPEHAGRPARELLHRLVELRQHHTETSAADAEHLPAYSTWRRHQSLAQRIAEALAEVSATSVLAAHPLRWLGDAVVQAEKPLQELLTLSDAAEALLDKLDEGLTQARIPKIHWRTVHEVELLIGFAQKFAGIANRGQLTLLDPQSEAFKELAAVAAKVATCSSTLARVREKTTKWREKLSPGDTAAALHQARFCEKFSLRFMLPSWWRLKSLLESHYDFSGHKVRPWPSRVLADLQAEYSAAAACEAAIEAGRHSFSEHPLQLHERLTELHSGSGAPRAYAALREVLLSPKGPALVETLAGLAPELSQLMEVLPKLVFDFRPYSLAAVSEAVRDLREESDSLPDLLPLLSELAETPRDFSNALRRFNLSTQALEAATAGNSLDKFYRSDRWLHRFDGRVLDRSVARIAAIEEEWLASNAMVTRCAIRKQFREHIQLATLSATQLDAEGKALKKSYSTGRRELEHEFAKSMRFRSIRDLSAGDSGAVVRDLKPIWLMSPLSVSDTLPLSATLFDVVIFDEASQIPVEEAVPALYRAPQVIVVGDEMQLPPTNFFGASQGEEAAEVEVEEDGERVAIALDADSLLTQSARNLSATLLAWHYRSRSESLIGFSNAAFYAGNLYTIPDRALPTAKQPELLVRAAPDAAVNVDALLARPISYHFMKHSPYANRRNPGEAAYLAQLVRELLNRSTGLSLGVVAFSEAQQSEIESALMRLANEDAKFAARLEAEYEREENDQFCGLFVKNLENVQGDERDIILLSICYGPDAQGRMLMNFGPINQRGGEKRLNVIFSRAKHHMAVVSSIRHTAITNEYNDGAAALKNFLNYAECASRGDMAAARQLLANLNPLTRRGLQNPAHDAVVEQLASALRERGCVVDTNIGQSRFRCDLAVCAADGRTYALGIIVDTEIFYANPDIAELCVTRPGILRAFGWRVMIVLTRDWWHEPEAVLERIDRLLRGELPAAAETSEPVLDPESTGPGASAERLDASTASAWAPEGASVVRRLELVAGKSSKFWEVAQIGCTLKIRYGRTGTKGQTLTKEFDTEAKTQSEMEKLIGEKLRKGYVET